LDAQTEVNLLDQIIKMIDKSMTLGYLNGGDWMKKFQSFSQVTVGGSYRLRLPIRAATGLLDVSRLSQRKQGEKNSLTTRGGFTASKMLGR
jgi:hypothetical protein